MGPVSPRVIVQPDDGVQPVQQARVIARQNEVIEATKLIGIDVSRC